MKIMIVQIAGTRGIMNDASDDNCLDFVYSLFLFNICDFFFFIFFQLQLIVMWARER
jgi:hypothetical protein